MTIATDSVDRGDGGEAAPLEPAIHQEFHAGLRLAELDLRCRHVRGPAVLPAREHRSVSDRLVRGIGDLGGGDRAGDPDAETVLEKSAGKIFNDRHGRGGAGNARLPLSLLQPAVRI